MLGYMNQEALNQTANTGLVTFFSRSKKRLWTKGESSGNTLQVQNILLDCDQDSILILANPSGPVCHTGADTCWNTSNEPAEFIYQLERIINDRKINPIPNSYTNRLMESGISKIAQKVGEEAVEVVIEALGQRRDLLLNECADLLYHFLVLLQAKEIQLEEVDRVLRSRHSGTPNTE